MDPRYTITLALPHHVDDIARIELSAAALLHGHAPAAVLEESTPIDEVREAQQAGRLWVALAGDLPVGFARVRMLGAGLPHLEEMDVIPEHGRRGLGTALLRTVVDWARRSAYHELTLTTFRAIPWNMPFYARLGFEEIPADELGPQLKSIVQNEAARGLDPAQRVVMRHRLELGPIREPPGVCVDCQTNAAPRAEAADHDAFERLTMPYLADIARFARSLTRDADGGNDLVQETYLQALRGWHTFRDGADPKRWLFTVCHHAFLRMAQRERRYVEAPYDDPELESLATASAHWYAHQSGVAQKAETMDLGPAIDRALSALPAHFRGAVVLVDIEGQTYEDAAVVLGVAVGTVRSRLFRGRRILQDLLFAYAADAAFETARSPSARAANPSRTPPLSRTDAP
jgi:RNA polymerase sigma-70 factor, ECF subfamily